MDTRFIQIASSFTSKPIEAALQRTLANSGVPDRLRFAMYAPMNQVLLAPDAQIAGTFVLLRLEDWLREALKSEAVPSPAASTIAVREILRARTDEFVQQISILSQNGKPVWFLPCPSLGWISGKHKLETVCQTYTNLLVARIRSLAQVTTLPWPTSLSQSEFQDHSADRLGQIPFTQEAFDKLGELLGQQLTKSTTRAQTASASPQDGSTQLSAYLKGLQVAVCLAPALAGDRANIDRLVRNAATFSLTGEQRDLTEANIDAYLASGNCLLVSVSDRLADYGVTALVAFRAEAEKKALSIHAFAVSCSVSGKQVEYAIVSALTEFAAEHKLTTLIFEYRPSERNQEVLTFLQSLADAGPGTTYLLPVSAFKARVQTAAAAPGAWTVRFERKASERAFTESVH